MAATVESSPNKAIYQRYIELINQQAYNSLPEVVNVEKYRENCVGYTDGWVDFPEAIQSVQKVYQAIPDLYARIDEMAAEGDTVYARATITGTNTGSMFGIPASNRSFAVNMFDYVRIENGKIVERIQQGDTVGQMKQLYSDSLKWLGVAAAGVLIGFSALLLFRRNNNGDAD